jgi:hypothetical protein
VDKPPTLKPPAKVNSVCPGKFLPLAVGNTWTYLSVQSDIAPPESMLRLLPLRPQKIVITVVSAEAKDGETTVKLNEKISYDISKDPTTPKPFEIAVESSITCSPKGKFDISPSSFFFAGEAGGFRGLAFPTFVRKKETSWKLTNGKFGEQEWIEEIAADYVRVPKEGSQAKLGGGKLEMERKFTPQPNESVRTALGIFQSTEKLGITTTGRIMMAEKLSPDGMPCTTKKLSPDKKTEVVEPTAVCDLPANWISQLWIAEGFGVVQAVNAYAHKLQLVEYKVN